MLHQDDREAIMRFTHLVEGFNADTGTDYWVPVDNDPDGLPWMRLMSGDKVFWTRELYSQGLMNIDGWWSGDPTGGEYPVTPALEEWLQHTSDEVYLPINTAADDCLFVDELPF